MASMTKNSFVSQTVLWTGCVVTVLGLFFDQSRTVFVTGLTLGSSGMVQSYYGSVFEIERAERLWYMLIGVPLAVGLAYVAFLSLDDYLPTWGMILLVLVATIGIQILISRAASHLWHRWHASDQEGIIG